MIINIVESTKRLLNNIKELKLIHNVYPCDNYSLFYNISHI